MKIEYRENLHPLMRRWPNVCIKILVATTLPYLIVVNVVAGFVVGVCDWWSEINTYFIWSKDDKKEARP